ncbi:HAMP domain-containing histidine kinase [Aquincola sp. S2]|uniref:histidine kinase n=2 Tax=Pseudaquabacterium terrae TaxID=2732868 RepID=A0ABX2EKI8_9BURK|nr:HAMP domain-containing sensor histidine kinase [Aquabacterium terrae]NRF69119.1 HAMP domain-containing histidine kinase [Aquabacterium terrae]
MALGVLIEEKQLAHRHYQAGLQKTKEQIVARLRHPTGQLALLNPRAGGEATVPLKPLVLPFSAIDFDDKTKVQQAVEMAGCLVQYRDGANLCVAVGNNPFAGGFIYLAGSFASGALVPHLPGDLDFGSAHRVRVSVAMRGQTWRWIAPFETLAEGANVGPSGAPGHRGRLTGYVDGVPITHGTKTVRDFRGWLWQDGRCADDSADPASDCAKRSFFSIRLPVEVFRDALFQGDRARIVWPPPDLAQILVRLQVLAPGEGAPLFDSDSQGAEPPFALADLGELLLPGERLRIRRQGATDDLATLVGRATDEAPRARWLDGLVRRLPVEGYDAPLELRESIATSLGRYELQLSGDVRSVNRTLAAVATRVSGFVGAMLAAVLVAWLLIELRIIRRITLLTKRAASVSKGMRSAGGLPRIDVADLRGSDELGVLAQGLQDLLQRVDEDLRREQIRAQQEKDQWHAVGHEIVSPLQSLLALHGAADDPSHRYLRRMQQAVQVLYGQASPSEAFESTTLQLAPLDLDAFLGHVAANADAVGVRDLRYASPGAPVNVRADEFSLEDVVTHVLRNADRHRVPGSPITLRLNFDAREARVEIHNEGAPIADAMLEKIFEYGVSEHADEGDETDEGHRGQGLFVARTYMAKMGGTIAARNADGGVVFTLRLPRV